MEENTGTATENGEQTAKETPQGNQQQEKSVPYSRFQELNAAKKLAESALEAIVKEMEQDVPEAMRDLIPASLPASERAAWIRSAKAKGLFTASVPASSPDAKRPAGKTTQDLSAMTPLQMLQSGYGKK